MDYVCYDKAKWHFSGDFPEDLPTYQGYVHTGMFIGWLADNDLLSGKLVEEAKLVKRRDRTGTQVYEDWDGVLDSDMLTDKGNTFASHYFNFEQGTYLSDYEEVLSYELPTMYHVADNWENYQKISRRIGERYRYWKAR